MMMMINNKKFAWDPEMYEKGKRDDWRWHEKKQEYFKRLQMVIKKAK